MSHPTNRAERQQQRYTKGVRRLREDRAQHEAPVPGRLACPCFEPDAGHGHGVVFARFADNPTMCSGPCCGNPRRWFGTRTRQEVRSD